MATAILTPDTQSRSTPLPRALAKWLLGTAMLVFFIVIVGGITRLTESGLSITEWQPVTGALPPLSQAAWLLEFEKYRAIPEYREINGPAGMTLAQFQFIYFWEWAHRLLARLLGFAFALPLAWFAWKRAIPKGYAPRLLALLALGGLQGSIGWWMVSSGLVLRTDVSHFRLATHLLMALFILSGMIWTALDLLALAKNPQARPARLTGFAALVLITLTIQLLFGAWVAGLNAGQIANSWPLMNDHFVPEGIDWTSGVASALGNDPYLIHFIHRWWAWVAVIALVIMARNVKALGSRPAAIAIHGTIGLQILLGIATVFTGVNIILAVLHQAMGAILVACTIWGAHIIGAENAKSV